MYICKDNCSDISKSLNSSSCLYEGIYISFFCLFFFILRGTSRFLGNQPILNQRVEIPACTAIHCFSPLHCRWVSSDILSIQKECKILPKYLFSLSLSFICIAFHCSFCETSRHSQAVLFFLKAKIAFIWIKIF